MRDFPSLTNQLLRPNAPHLPRSLCHRSRVILLLFYCVALFVSNTNSESEVISNQFTKMQIQRHILTRTKLGHQQLRTLPCLKFTRLTLINGKYIRGGQEEEAEANLMTNDVRMEDANMAETNAADDAEFVPEVPTVQDYFWEAAKLGQEDRIEKLVQDGADVNAHDPTFGGWTAMHYAAQNGRWRAISALVRLGARVRIIPTAAPAEVGADAEAGGRAQRRRVDAALPRRRRRAPVPARAARGPGRRRQRRQYVRHAPAPPVRRPRWRGGRARGRP